MKKRKIGAPRKYRERAYIRHTIEADLLQRVDELADFKETRTDIINKAIELYVIRRGKS